MQKCPVWGGRCERQSQWTISIPPGSQVIRIGHCLCFEFPHLCIQRINCTKHYFPLWCFCICMLHILTIFLNCPLLSCYLPPSDTHLLPWQCSSTFPSPPFRILHMRGNMWCLFCWVLLIWLNTMISSHIHFPRTTWHNRPIGFNGAIWNQSSVSLIYLKCPFLPLPPT